METQTWGLKLLKLLNLRWRPPRPPRPPRLRCPQKVPRRPEEGGGWFIAESRVRYPRVNIGNRWGKPIETLGTWSTNGQFSTSFWFFLYVYGRVIHSCCSWRWFYDLWSLPTIRRFGTASNATVTLLIGLGRKRREKYQRRRFCAALFLSSRCTSRCLISKCIPYESGVGKWVSVGDYNPTIWVMFN